MSTAQLFDIAAALILATLAFIGFLRGFVGAVMSFVGLACGTYFAWEFSSGGTTLFLQYFPDVDETIANIAAMAIIFLGVAIIASLISRLLTSLVKFAKLSGANHLAGALIGLLTGSALIIMVYGAITLLVPEAGHLWMGDSIFMNIAEKVWPRIQEFLTSYGYDPANLVHSIK
ncbi:MAG: CvpA family protein [Synergistaceae bacterium]|nr:CvpA family protein [Synergistaceae bacterium]